MPYYTEWIYPDILAEHEDVKILQVYYGNNAQSPSHFRFVVLYKGGDSDVYAAEEKGEHYDICNLPGYQEGLTLPEWNGDGPTHKWLQSLLENGTITKEWDTVAFPKGDPKHE